MLILRAFINHREIDQIWIHNEGQLEELGKIEEEGVWEYKVVRPKGIPEKLTHHRRKGWVPLALKALTLVLKKEQEKEKEEGEKS